ncbi:MAG: tRNA (N6-isopentenyl adenosine(37)-C2)-methylthiotransferase MiaB [Alphaproteobacteria bacterium]|nr:tRNA (N6-isopentenyl adenosine(37)-C2)-methylthiotransferase MiaB [Alphaproteobacteria bacterium]
MLKKYFIKTYGCQMNVYDSHRMAKLLENEGYEKTDCQQDADIVLFNTCHIREKAAEKLFSDLGRALIIKNEREEKKLDTIIGVTGCVVQAEDGEILKRAPYVDFALGPLTYHKLPEVLHDILQKKKEHIVDSSFPVESKFDFLPQNEACGGCSFLAVQEGCNNFCTYCVVPYTRGVEYSRPVEDVIKEAKRLVETGTLEINLLGQNVNSYHGEDENGKERNLAYLLYKMAEIDGLKRLRYTTSYPADMTDELIACHKNIDILMPYLHLPVQSGSNKILKLMNRRHTREAYIEIVQKLKKANPKLEMSSDFIVGFPGETDEDFEQTLTLVEKIGYIQAFSFKYSKRPGTPAATMENQVAEKVKKERLDILQKRLFEMQTAFNLSCEGKVFEVLFEQTGRHKGQLIGRTPYMQNVHAQAQIDVLGQIRKVKILSSTTNSLEGKVVL